MDKPQAGPPNRAVSSMMGMGQLILKAPASLTFWDSNYRSEIFIPDSLGNPWVQFHLPGLVGSSAGTVAFKKE